MENPSRFGINRRIVTPVIDEIANSPAVGLVVKVVDGGLQRPKVIETICGVSELLAGAPMLPFVNPGEQPRDVMLAEGRLLFRVEPLIDDVIFSGGIVPARIGVRGEPEKTCFKGSVAHRFRVGEPPVGSDIGNLRFIRGSNVHRTLERSARGVISRDIHIKGNWKASHKRPLPQPAARDLR